MRRQPRLACFLSECRFGLKGGTIKQMYVTKIAVVSPVFSKLARDGLMFLSKVPGTKEKL